MINETYTQAESIDEYAWLDETTLWQDFIALASETGELLVPESWLPENPAPLIGLALFVAGLIIIGLIARAALLGAAYAAGYLAGMFNPRTLFVLLVIGWPFALVYWGNRNERH